MLPLLAKGVADSAPSLVVRLTPPQRHLRMMLQYLAWQRRKASIDQTVTWFRGLFFIFNSLVTRSLGRLSALASLARHQLQ